MKYFVLGVFILMYLLIIIKPNLKVFITGGVALIVTLGLLIFANGNILEILSKIKIDIMMMLIGIMLTFGTFADSNMPSLIANKLMKKMPNSIMAIVVISTLSGVVSAFVDNVATVLMLAPIGLAIAKKIDVSPIPVLISIAVSSNLQGAATLVGDTTSMMLANAADMSFFDFFFFNGKFSIFWAVELGALLTIPVIIFVFRKDNKKLLFEGDKVEVTTKAPTIILCLNLLALVIASFFENVRLNINLVGESYDITAGTICMICGIASVIIYSASQKEKIMQCVKRSFDYETVLFLIFLFLIIGIVRIVGIIDDISEIFKSLASSNLFLLFVIIVLGSVILSAFIDNIPYVATMLPVIAGLSSTLDANACIVLYFGLLIGATLGGNITPVGASANVVAIGILEKNGYKVKSSDFFKIGIPFTLVAVLVGSIFTWLVWGM